MDVRSSISMPILEIAMKSMFFRRFYCLEIEGNDVKTGFYRQSSNFDVGKNVVLHVIFFYLKTIKTMKKHRFHSDFQNWHGNRRPYVHSNTENAPTCLIKNRQLNKVCRVRTRGPTMASAKHFQQIYDIFWALPKPNVNLT